MCVQKFIVCRNICDVRSGERSADHAKFECLNVIDELVRSGCGCFFTAARRLRTLCKLLPIKGGKLFLQALKFREVVNGDVRLIAMARDVVLMISLGRVETVERNYFG